ncbi:TIR domain-containing protein [Pyxidicoccus sp. 3LG]
MYRLNVIHAEADTPWVTGFLLSALGLPDGQVMVPAEFRLGLPVLEEVTRAIEHSDVTVVVLSKALSSDDWGRVAASLVTHRALLEQGRGRLIPLRLDDVEVDLGLATLVQLEMRDPARWEAEVARLREVLGQTEPATEQLPCPYPGMRPYSEPTYFFGREDETDRMLQHLRHHRSMFVIGPSGSGKSSLVRAGLVPALEKGHAYFDHVPWTVRLLRPGAEPDATLAVALGGSPTPQTLSALLPAREAGRLLVVVDQLEELFTQATPSHRGAFIRNLEWLRAQDRCAVALVMRADFYPELMQSEFWPVPAAERIEVVPLRGEALRPAIEGPARKVGVHVDSRLTDRLIVDARNEPGVLPMLQETLRLLWAKRHRRFIPVQLYATSDDPAVTELARAITIHADATIAALSPEQQRLARRVFLRLVQFGEGRADLRRQQLWGALRSDGDDRALLDKTLQHLAEQRLLTVSGEEQHDPEKRKVDISHEALIQSWEQLRTWVGRKREAEQTRRRLDQKVDEWKRLGRGQGGLLDAVELLDAERWLRESDARELGISPDLPALIRESRKQLERRTRILWLTTGVSVFFALAAIFAMSFFFEAQRQAEREADNAKRATQLAEQQRRDAVSQRLAAQSSLQIERDPSLGLRLAAEAAEIAPTTEATSNLMRSLQRYDRVAAFLPGHQLIASDVRFGRDGRLLISGRKDETSGEVRFWDKETGWDARNTVKVPTERGFRLAVSPDGSRFATLSVEGLLSVHDVRAQGAPEVKDLGADVRELEFLGSSKLIVTSRDEISTWRVSPLGLEKQQAVPAHALAVAREKQVLAVSHCEANRERCVFRMFDAGLSRMGTATLMSTPKFPIIALALSPEGRTLAVGVDSHVYLYGNGGNRLLPKGSLRAIPAWSFSSLDATGGVVALAFSPDGRSLVAGTRGGQIVLWSRSGSASANTDEQDWSEDSARELRRMHQPGEHWKLSFSFSPDGQTLAIATGPLDDSPFARVLPRSDLFLWRPFEESKKAIAVSGAVSELAFSPDGGVLAAGMYRQGGLGVWKTPDLSPLAIPEAPSCEVANVAFAKDGRLAWDCRPIGDREDVRAKEVWLWTPGDLRPPQRILSQKNRVFDLAFTPDGGMLGVSDDRGIALVDSAGADAGTFPLELHGLDIVFDAEDRLVFATRDPLGVGACSLSNGDDCRSVLSHDATTATLSPLGHVVAFELDGRVVLWDLVRRAMHGNALDAFWASTQGSVGAFSPDGRILATVLTDFTSHDRLDRRIQLWDVATGQRMAESLVEHGGRISSLAFTPDGAFLVSAGWDGRIVFHDMRVESWIAKARAMANRPFTDEERRLYLQDAPRAP